MSYKKIVYGTGKYANKRLSSGGFSLNWWIVIGVSIYFYFKGKIGNGDNNEVVVKPNMDNITFDEIQSEVYASQLLDAMNKIGTDVSLISDVFDEFKTADDFKLVYNAFGKKPYNGWRLADGGFLWGIGDSSTDKDLVGWLKDELNKISDYPTYKKVRNVVEKAGFVF